MSHGASGTSLSEYDTKHFSRFLQLDIYRKRFVALKVLEKCKKHFCCFQNMHNLPPNLTLRLGPCLSLAKLFATSNCVSLPYLMLHWGTQCDITFWYHMRFWPHDDWTNLKANCTYFESKKTTFYIFPTLKNLRNVSIDIQLQETREKNFLSYAL